MNADLAQARLRCSNTAREPRGNHIGIEPVLTEPPGEGGREASMVREGYLTHRTGSHIVFFRRVKDDGAGIEIVRILHERMEPSRHIR